MNKIIIELTAIFTFTIMFALAIISAYGSVDAQTIPPHRYMSDSIILNNNKEAYHLTNEWQFKKDVVKSEAIPSTNVTAIVAKVLEYGLLGLMLGYFVYKDYKSTFRDKHDDDKLTQS